MTMIDSQTLRRRLEEVLLTDADLDAFVLDSFPDVYKRFSGRMERTDKINLLFQLVPDRDQILEKIEQHSTKSSLVSPHAPAASLGREGKSHEKISGSPASAPQKSTRREKLDWHNPAAVLRAAITAVPVMKYALGVAGLGAAVAITTKGFGLDPGTATIGALIVAVLMMVLILLSAAARQSERLTWPAMVLTWGVTLGLVSSLALLILSFFFSWPKSTLCLFKTEHCNTSFEQRDVMPNPEEWIKKKRIDADMPAIRKSECPKPFSQSKAIAGENILNIVPIPFGSKGSIKDQNVSISKEDGEESDFYRIMVSKKCVEPGRYSHGGAKYEVLNLNEKMPKYKKYKVSFCAWSINADGLKLRVQHGNGNGEVTGLSRTVLISNERSYFEWEEELDGYVDPENSLNLNFPQKYLHFYLFDPKQGRACGSNDLNDAVFSEKQFVIGHVRIVQGTTGAPPKAEVSQPKHPPALPIAPQSASSVQTYTTPGEAEKAERKQDESR